MPDPDTDSPLTQAVLTQLEAEIVAHRYSVTSLAAALGMDRNTLRRWVKGERDLPLPVLTAILDQLRLDPAVFMARARDRLREQ